MRTVVIYLIAVLCVVSLMAQSKPQSTSAPHPTNNVPAISVGKPVARQSETGLQQAATASGNEPVVTVDGVCEHSGKNSRAAGCKVAITRAQMNSLMNAVEPTASPLWRKEFAINYAKVFAAAEVAKRRQIDKDPVIARELEIQQNIVRMQVLANALYQRIEAQAANIPASEIDKFYEEHKASFEQGEVRRLSIPKLIATTTAQPQDESVWRAKAEELRSRALAGDDFDQMQTDVYKEVGVSFAAPTTKLSMIRRANLPANEQIIFDLQPGGVSPVLDSQSAFVILKLESKQRMSLEEVRPEIQFLLRRQRTMQELQDATQSAKAQFDLTYLDVSAAPQLFPPPTLTQLSSQQNTPSRAASRMKARRWTPSRVQGMGVVPGARP